MRGTCRLVLFAFSQPAVLADSKFAGICRFANAGMWIGLQDLGCTNVAQEGPMLRGISFLLTDRQVLLDQTLHVSYFCHVDVDCVDRDMLLEHNM
jgi:hypothetical protein